ncbi:nitrate reductase molybdenum cofactor assembly chaperone [Nocardioides sp. Bht2]|uniref:nitrate reductase molybdenum cofactor assembly chaperone n=1 Tax=Nocardioides sp. Bht2 TaxID=3392297 RepID=UPI0039B5F1FD
MRARSQRLRAERRQQNRVLHQVAAWCLSYPDEQLLDQLPLLQAALGEIAVDDRGLSDLLELLGRRPLEDSQRAYVELFDLDRKHALHLSYWTDGDTRRRGEALAGFKSVYRDSGFLVRTGGELPDHLCLVLEFAAVVDPEAGSALLQQYRASLELLRLGLIEAGSPYAAALSAVCSTLPGASPTDRAAAMALHGPPPTETVGLEPFDPRLLPMLDTEVRS